MCDKCNDFVFHYLLDYSCRVFVSFLCFFSRFCTILSAHSQKTVDFNRNVCGGCRKFVRTCSLFSARKFQHTLQSSRFEFNSSKLFGVVSLCVCAPFYRIFFCLLRVQDDCKVLFFFITSRRQSAFPCFYLL